MSNEPTAAGATHSNRTPGETFAAADGARLWFTTSGHGDDAILLCNGGPGCSDYLGPVAAMVDDVLQAVRFEQRGCGRSECRGPYDVATTVADLERLRAHLGITQWRVAGHSWGADLALAYALHFPQRTRQVVCISGGRIHNDRQWHAVYSRRRDDVGELVPPAQSPYNNEVNTRLNQSWQDFCKRPDLLARIAALQVPVHYLLAGEDIRPNWPLLQVAALLPKGRVEIVHGAPHSMWLTHPTPFRAALRRALSLTP